MNYANYLPAIRAFDRIMAPIQRDMDEAAACDAHFDGGEWSGPAHARIQNEVEDQMYLYVAEKFGIPVKEFVDSVQWRGYHEHNCLMDAVLPDNSDWHYTAGNPEYEADLKQFD